METFTCLVLVNEKLNILRRTCSFLGFLKVPYKIISEQVKRDMKERKKTAYFIGGQMALCLIGGIFLRIIILTFAGVKSLQFGK